MSTQNIDSKLEETKQIQSETQIDAPPRKTFEVKGKLLQNLISYQIEIINLSLKPSNYLITIGDAPSRLLAWCSGENNMIRIAEPETEEEHANFNGVKLKKQPGFICFSPQMSIG